MGLFWAIASISAFIAGLIFPGLAIAKRLLKSPSTIELVVSSCGFGLLATPTLTFAVTWALGIPFSIPVIFLVAIFIVVCCRPWKIPKQVTTTRDELIALGFLFLACILLLQVTEFRAVRPFRFLECCLHSVAAYLWLDEPPMFQLPDPRWPSEVTYVLSRPAGPVFGLGLWIAEQRPMNGAIVAVAMLLAGRAGIELLSLLVFFTIGGAFTLSARAFLKTWLQCAFAGVVTLVGLHGLIAYMLNESSFALAFSALALALMLRHEPDRLCWLGIGFLFGGAIGSRMSALPVAAGAVISLLTERRRQASLIVILGAVSAALPWFLTYLLLTGNPFFHTSDHLQIEHSVLGFSFRFRPLNWPFFEKVVRPPSDALPPLFYVPVKIMVSAGSIFVAAGIIGFARMWRTHRHLFVLTLLWAFPLCVFMMLLADLDYEKLSWIIVALPVVALAIGSFVAAIHASVRRVLAIWVTLSAVLAFFPMAFFKMDIELDPRHLPLYVPDGDAFNPQSLEEPVDTLMRPAILPSFQKVETPSFLIESLLLPRTPGAIPPKHVFVRLDGREDTEISFPIATSLVVPTPPEIPRLEPKSLLQFVNMQTLFVLQVESSSVAEVRVRSTHDVLHIAITSGPPPHAKRFLYFLLDEQRSDDAEWGISAGDIVVELDGKRLETNLLGYRLTKDQSTRDIFVLVTNLKTPPQPATNGAFQCDSGLCHWQWIEVLGLKGDTNMPLLDVVGPFYW